jgi:hypothetical protein
MPAYLVRHDCAPLLPGCRLPLPLLLFPLSCLLLSFLFCARLSSSPGNHSRQEYVNCSLERNMLCKQHATMKASACQNILST